MADLKALIAKRGQIKGLLTKFQAVLDENTTDLSIIQARLAKIEPLYESFMDIQLEISLCDNDKNTVSDDDTDRFESCYFKAITTAKSRLTDSSNSQIKPHVNVNSKIQLPTLKLPTFSGALSEWSCFEESFTSLIENNHELSTIQKFHYLKSSLTGEAARLIASIELSVINYSIAWQLLNERYANKRLIIQNHIQSIFDIATIKYESFKEIQAFLDKIQINLRALKSFNLPTEHWDALLIYYLSKKLDPITAREWERTPIVESNSHIQSMETFIKFLTNKSQLLQSIQRSSSTSHKSNNNNNNKPNLTFLSSQHNCCKVCKEIHSVYQCPQFQKMTIQERINSVKRFNFCYNCLGNGHSYSQCRSNTFCKTCNKKHHTLLHKDVQGESEQIPTISATSITTEAQALLSTVIINVQNAQGHLVPARALLDSGSQTNYITTKLATQLGVPLTRSNTPIIGITGATFNGQFKTDISISSRFKKHFKKQISCICLNEITPNIPANTIVSNAAMLPSKMKLADPTYHQPASIDILLGCDVFWSCLERKRTNIAGMLLQQTAFGWVITHANTSATKGISLFSITDSNALHELMAKFWHLEENLSHPLQSLEEKAAESHFIETYSRNEDGRFVVELPLKGNPQDLGSSLTTATKRWHSVERKLSKSPSLQLQYSEFMNEYIQLNHMSEISLHSNNSSHNNQFYLPHHSILRESSETTKLRVVFDGSAKTTSGLSLNDILMVGPTIQDDLLSIILRFRTRKYIISADIEKMYRQILITPKHRDLQRIVWSESSNQLSHFSLNTVTYGTASAPYLATRCLRQLALDTQEYSPEASNSIMHDFYVDDLLTGSNDYETARQLRDSITSILNSACMNLRKWKSNDVDLISDETSINQSVDSTLLGKSQNSKTLGLIWNSSLDILKYQHAAPYLESSITKRNLLSQIAKLFDPLGLVAPIHITAKLFIQQLWQLKIDWDSDVPNHVQQAWLIFQHQLKDIEQLSIPRHVLTTKEHSELHGFCDSSERAYGACIYMRTMENGVWICRLLCSRSRVAPLKTISLPRLELSGALLLSQLMKKVTDSLSFQGSTTYWCDSTITLAWIAASPARWKTFVANRVSEIQDKTLHGQWRHISSQLNPADLISRGVVPKDLVSCNLWWNGPLWLSQDETHWPTIVIADTPELPEQKSTSQTFITQIQDFSIFDRYSTLHKLQRVIAYCNRFKANSLRKFESQTNSLTVSELKNAMTMIVKLVQEQCFSSDIKALQSKSQCLSSNSKLLSLNAFLDSENVLRVGGRLSNSNLTYNQKHPVILPSNHQFTTLIINHFHRQLLHAGPQALLANIRLEFWPLCGRRTVRSVLRKCIVCFRAKPTINQPLMGNQHPSRVQPTRPFHTCGVDYAGPYYIKSGNIRSKTTSKVYLCIFVCFSTKAIHLELATDLSTYGFIKCFHRFISRRGRCAHIYSDNAGNFVGSSNELKSLTSFLQNPSAQNAFSDFFASHSIQWHFIPARSPHFGGLWESAVKSAKHHLTRVLRGLTLTFEELYTVLTQVEACLNSRPLTPLSDNPSDLSPLTPGHFLIGESLVAPPQLDLTSTNPGKLSRFERATQLVQHFWQRWSKEYLSLLQERSKWRTKTSDVLQPGSLVLLAEDNLPPTKWALGRILHLHPGTDGITRAATVSTATSTVTRAANRLCVLPLN